MEDRLIIRHIILPPFPALQPTSATTNQLLIAIENENESTHRLCILSVPQEPHPNSRHPRRRLPSLFMSSRTPSLPRELGRMIRSTWSEGDSEMRMTGWHGVCHLDAKLSYTSVCRYGEAEDGGRCAKKDVRCRNRLSLLQRTSREREG